MKKFNLFVLTAIMAVMFAACGDYAENKPAANTANAANTETNSGTETATAAPTKEEMLATEKEAWEAWKKRDFKFFEDFLSEKYVGFTPAGRVDKAGAIKTLSEQKCEINSYSLSDDQMTMVGADVAVLTFKGEQDYTCDGKKGPANILVASVYVREGDKWKNAFYNEVPDPESKAAPAKPEAKPAAATKPAEEAKSADELTTTLQALELKGWEAWKNKDGKTLDELTAKEFTFIDTNVGRYDKEAILKTWAEAPCEVKGVSVTDALASSLSSDAAILTYKGSVDGTCDGDPVPTVWGATVFGKDGETWKYFTMIETPA